MWFNTKANKSYQKIVLTENKTATVLYGRLHDKMLTRLAFILAVPLYVFKITETAASGIIFIQHLSAAVLHINFCTIIAELKLIQIDWNKLSTHKSHISRETHLRKTLHTDTTMWTQMIVSKVIAASSHWHRRYFFKVIGWQKEYFPMSTQQFYKKKHGAKFIFLGFSSNSDEWHGKVDNAKSF